MARKDKAQAQAAQNEETQVANVETVQEQEQVAEGSDVLSELEQLQARIDELKNSAVPALQAQKAEYEAAIKGINDQLAKLGVATSTRKGRSTKGQPGKPKAKKGESPESLAARVAEWQAAKDARAAAGAGPGTSEAAPAPAAE